MTRAQEPVRMTTPDRGLSCPRCGCRHLPVVYTRPRENCIVRARDCRNCGKRIITRERL